MPNSKSVKYIWNTTNPFFNVHYRFRFLSLVLWFHLSEENSRKAFSICFSNDLQGYKANSVCRFLIWYPDFLSKMSCLRMLKELRDQIIFTTIKSNMMNRRIHLGKLNYVVRGFMCMCVYVCQCLCVYFCLCVCEHCEYSVNPTISLTIHDGWHKDLRRVNQRKGEKSVILSPNAMGWQIRRKGESFADTFPAKITMVRLFLLQNTNILMSDFRFLTILQSLSISLYLATLRILSREQSV